MMRKLLLVTTLGVALLAGAETAQAASWTISPAGAVTATGEDVPIAVWEAGEWDPRRVETRTCDVTLTGELSSGTHTWPATVGRFSGGDFANCDRGVDPSFANGDWEFFRSGMLLLRNVQLTADMGGRTCAYAGLYTHAAMDLLPTLIGGSYSTKFSFTYFNGVDSNLLGYSGSDPACLRGLTIGPADLWISPGQTIVQTR